MTPVFTLTNICGNCAKMMIDKGTLREELEAVAVDGIS